MTRLTVSQLLFESLLATSTVVANDGAASLRRMLDRMAHDAPTGGLLQPSPPLRVILNELCNLFDAAAPGFASGILVFDRTRTRVRHAIAPGMSRRYGEILEGRSVTPQTYDHAHGGKLDESTCTWLPKPLPGDPTPGWSSPIVSSIGEVFGAFSIYRRDSEDFPPPEDFPPLPTLTQQFTCIAGVVIERSRAEEVHKRTESRHATAERLSFTGSFSWQPATGNMTWSEEVYRILALEHSLQPSLELMVSRVHPANLALFHEMIDRAREGSPFEYEHRLSLPDRSVKYVRVVARPSIDDDDQLEYHGAIQDVTQRRLGEETLDKLRSEFARLARVASLGALTASITHEVVQPLSGIITNAGISLRMLVNDPPNVEGARKTVRRTIRDGQRAYDVIARLRGLIAKKTLPRESVSLNQSVREVVSMLLSELQRSHATLQLELAEHLPSVIGDPVQLQQVIVNLLLNASEAMRDNGERPRQVVIKTWKGPCGACLSVQDSGVGLQDQDIERLFEAFYTSKTDGIGIGLSVSRSIIEAHGGRLWAGANDGPGATFSFSIPCNLADPGG
jgi:signal transduction histidine kinase